MVVIVAIIDDYEFTIFLPMEDVEKVSSGLRAAGIEYKIQR